MVSSYIVFLISILVECGVCIVTKEKHLHFLRLTAILIIVTITASLSLWLAAMTPYITIAKVLPSNHKIRIKLFTITYQPILIASFSENIHTNNIQLELKTRGSELIKYSISKRTERLLRTLFSTLDGVERVNFYLGVLKPGSSIIEVKHNPENGNIVSVITPGITLTTSQSNTNLDKVYNFDALATVTLPLLLGRNSYTSTLRDIEEKTNVSLDRISLLEWLIEFAVVGSKGVSLVESSHRIVKSNGLMLLSSLHPAFTPIIVYVLSLVIVYYIICTILKASSDPLHAILFYVIVPQLASVAVSTGISLVISPITSKRKVLDLLTEVMYLYKARRG